MAQLADVGFKKASGNVIANANILFDVTLFGCLHAARIGRR